MREALELGSICRHEEAAVGAFEPPVAFGLAGHQFGREGLLAARALDLVCRLLSGDLGHVATLPVLREVDAVIVERRPLRRRWVVAGRP